MSFSSSFLLHSANSVTAIRGRRPPTPRPFPSPRLGDPYSRDSDPRGHRCGRQLPERGYDQEWEEEGCEGEGEGGGTREEEELSAAMFFLWGELGRWDEWRRVGGILYMFWARECGYWSSGEY